MSDDFDPYLKWLGIRESERPPNSYQLLGLELFESDPEVISNAADRQMAHVRTFQSGRHSALSQRVLNELASARVNLLNVERKRAYDAQLLAAEESLQQTDPLDIVHSLAIPESLIPDPVFEPPAVSQPLGAIEVSPVPYSSAIGRRLRMNRRRVDHTALTVSLVVAAVLLAGLTFLVVADQWRRAPAVTNDGASSSVSQHPTPPASR